MMFYEGKFFVIKLALVFKFGYYCYFIYREDILLRNVEAFPLPLTIANFMRVYFRGQSCELYTKIRSFNYLSAIMRTHIDWMMISSFLSGSPQYRTNNRAIIINIPVYQWSINSKACKVYIID